MSDESIPCPSTFKKPNSWSPPPNVSTIFARAVAPPDV
jgi:hypothetical protein